MNQDADQISFNDTRLAFAYKTNKQLKLARFLFQSMGNELLLGLGLKLMPLAIKWNLPFAKKLTRKTIFSQFVGGENLEQTRPVINKLANYKVQVILDYGVEGGDGGDADYDHAMQEFNNVIKFAATQPNVPFISIKVTGIARFSLLENIDSAMQQAGGSLVKRYESVMAKLSIAENEEWLKVLARFRSICETAATSKVGVLVDAEETWIQDPVDAITLLMMDEFNKTRPIVYNTVQLYRHDRLAFLIDCYAAAVARQFVLAVKIVRGAYMEKERARAKEKNYPSPIQPTKQATDDDYNAAIDFCLDQEQKIALIVATHNEESNLKAARKLGAYGTDYIHFSQLYGMSDNITFNLAAAGCSVSKYLPFGPINDVVPYLMRRAQENSSVGGQTSRELELINREISRRKI